MKRLALVLLCAAAAPAAAAPTVRVISVGDSYASGEGAPDKTNVTCNRFGFSCKTTAEWKANPDGDEWQKSDHECHRSSKAGPLAATRRFVERHGELAHDHHSVACSGAQIIDLISRAQPDHPNMREQLAMVRDRFRDQRIDALVVSIGGNDIGFGAAVRYCMFNPGQSCYLDPPFWGDYRITPWGDIEGSPDARRAVLESRYTRLRDFIASELPNVVNVFITEYPDPVRDDSGNFCNHSPSGDLLQGVSGDEARWTSETAIKMLNEEVVRAAGAPGWLFVGGVAAPFRTHGYCASDNWLNTVGDSENVQGGTAGSVHPNDAGQNVYRDAIAGALESLIPPSTPQLLTRGIPNSKNDKLVVTRKDITLAWQHPGAHTFQLAFRDAPYRPFETTRPGPTQPPDDILADPPRVTRDGSWSYLTNISGLSFKHGADAKTFDYAVRACTRAACSRWSNVVNVSNRFPGAVTLGLQRVRGNLVDLVWNTPATGFDVVHNYQVAWRPGGFWWVGWEPAGFSQYTTFSHTPPWAGGFDYHVRACTLFMCGSWSNGVQAWNQLPPAPQSLLRSGSDLTWNDPGGSEQQFEIAYVTALWDYPRRVGAPMNATRAAVPSDYHSWIRACNDAGCSGWIGRTSSGPYYYVVPPAPSWAPPARPANLPGPVAPGPPDFNL